MSESEQILKIINAVKKHECLWNVNANDYAKRDKLEKAWKNVAQEVGKSEIFCRDKWRNVRTGFLRSIQHQIRRSSHEDDVSQDFPAVKRKSFYLHDQMSFFLPAAEALEQARKKRKLSKDHRKSNVMETGNDTDGDNSLMAAYNLVGKFEATEDIDDDTKSNHENDEIEHHTLLINGDIYTVNDEDVNRDDCNIDEILKRIENKKISEELKTLIPNKAKVNEDFNHDTKTLSTKKLNQSIVKENNNTDILKENSESITKFSNEISCNQELHFSDREEQQLLHFFRSCTDDILALSKRKQRLFKKRLLDLIDELHDS